jgi:hypothetical protein
MVKHTSTLPVFHGVFFLTRHTVMHFHPNLAMHHRRRQSSLPHERGRDFYTVMDAFTSLDVCVRSLLKSLEVHLNYPLLGVLLVGVLL